MQRTGRNTATGVRFALAASLIVWAGTGCSLDSLLKTDEIPPNITDPALTQTPQGALAAYHGTIALFRSALGDYNGRKFVAMTGMLSDELRNGQTFGSANPDLVDALTLSESDDGLQTAQSYNGFQKVRGQAGQAIGLLNAYAPEQRALTGHVYALEGYAEVLLAEFFCSGVPLSTLDFNGDYTVKPASSTEQVLSHAIALFDTTLSLAGDSTRFVHLAAVGKARALLGLGQYAAAAAAVAAVPDDYRYNVIYGAGAGSAYPENFAYVESGLWPFSVADQEGGNGLDYVSSGDPRTAVTLQGANSYGYPVYRPAKYATNGASPIVLASGVEARLIEAEAALQQSDVTTWLAKLNALRTDGTFTVDSQAVVDNSVSPPDTTWTYDTLWHAGTGGYDGLRPLDDPGTIDGRVNLLFRERAFWLFLTGHRQGDMRRLIRQYGRAEDTVYPVGAYPGALGMPYGSDVTAPVPVDEQSFNPLYTGCISRDA